MTKQTSRRAFLTLTAFGAATAGLTGCSLLGIDSSTPSGSGSGSGSGSDAPAAPAEGLAFDPERTLVAYFSVPETDEPDGMTQDEENSTHVVDGVVYGNTQYVAMLLEQRIGAGLFRIETAEDLPLDHDTLIARANEWLDGGTRPELKELIPNLDDYDTIIVGYPIWEFDLPMPLYTFFEQHDFAGKNVVVYTTHDVSGLSGTLETVTGMLPDAKVSQNAFDISRNDMDDSEARVNSWIDTFEA